MNILLNIKSFIRIILKYNVWDTVNYVVTAFKIFFSYTNTVNE
jgi:hypothetical protein